MQKFTKILAVLVLGSLLLVSGCAAVSTGALPPVAAGQEAEEPPFLITPPPVEPSTEAEKPPVEPIPPGSDLPDSSQREDGQLVTDPDSILVLVNKTSHLPEDYEPQDLVQPDVPFPFTEDLPKKLLRREAAAALEELFAAAKEEGLKLFAQSGYRSYQRQAAIFAANADKHGEEYANTFSARPGESEHQTGLAMDVTSSEVNYLLEQEFASTPEGLWLKDHAHEFGFIIRYPKDREAETGYTYEPWHLRYVGREAAGAIFGQGLILEEFLAQQTPSAVQQPSEAAGQDN